MVERFTKSFVILLFVCAALVHAKPKQNTQEVFLRANKEYKEGQFQKARELYESITPKGRAVWYNLGNSLYQLKQYPHAIAAWRRAQEGAPLEELKNIEYNINCAREQSGYRAIINPTWYRLLRASTVLVPLVLIELIFLLAWYLLFWVVIIRRGTKGIMNMILITVLLCIIVWFGAALYVHHQESCYAKAVVHQQTAVYAGPHDRYHVVGELVSSDELNILEQRAGWCKIMHDQTYGWVPVCNITIV